MPYDPSALQRIRDFMFGQQQQGRGPATPGISGQADPRFPFPPGPYQPQPPQGIESHTVYGRPVPNMENAYTPPPKMSPVPVPGGAAAPGAGQSTPSLPPAQPANAAPEPFKGAPQSSPGGSSPFEGLPPELIAQVIGLGDNDVLRKQLEQQLLQAQAMRQRQLPGGIHTGRVYMADSPLTVIGNGLAAWRGHKKQNKAEAEQRALGREETEARRRMFESLMNQKRNPPPRSDILV